MIPKNQEEATPLLLETTIRWRDYNVPTEWYLAGFLFKYASAIAHIDFLEGVNLLFGKKVAETA